MTLKQDFESRKTWHNNRSSTIFPIDIKDNSDFALVFINYWKIKNKIKNLKCNMRIFDQEGNILKLHQHNLKIHNEIYISNFFKVKRFLGIVEVEFISLDNLRFAFPGITGFYISPKKLISGVHAAGRIIHSSEGKKYLDYSLETNFSLKFIEKKVVPFISLFNSNVEKKLNPIFLELKNNFNKTIKKISINNRLKKPYSNKIFYLDDYFKKEYLKKSAYCIVKTNNSDVFPRMICGNYHKKLHHYEVTHSFPVQQNQRDRIDNKYMHRKDVDHISFLSFVKPKKVNLKLRVFPTNLSLDLNTKLLIYDKKNKKLKIKKFFSFNPGKKMFEYDVQDNEEFGCISLKQKNIPARINASFIYSNNNKLGLSTDIATGFHSIDYPIKQMHWGSFFSSSKIKTNILIKRTNHFKCLKKTKGSITFYGKNIKKKINIVLLPTDFKIIRFNEIIKNQNDQINSYSWIAKFKNGSGVEFFCNSYGKDFISGDHAF